MRGLIIISVLFSAYSDSEGKAQNWDVFNKHRQLIESQGVFHESVCGGTQRDVYNHFREAIYSLGIPLYKKIFAVSDSNFVFSPLTVWQTLAAIAEGTSGQTREELFRILRLPEDTCIRRQYYQLASSLEPPSEDVNLSRSTTLILDDSVIVNHDWEEFVHKNLRLQTQSAHLKSDPVGAADVIRKFGSLQLPSPNLEGNSVLVDTLDFKGLWTDAFSDAIIERAPFFDDLGKKIGYVDLMKMKKRVKMTYIPSAKLKILELPVGFGGRYRMLFGLSQEKHEFRASIPAIMENLIFEVEETLKESIIPLEVAIPRLRMTTEIDMRKILEDLGVKALWNEVEGTRNISEPSALPSGFILRTTVTLDTTGVRAPIQEVSNLVPESLKGSSLVDPETGLDPILGKDFIANRPVTYALFDAKTYTCLFTTVISAPTYKI